jgi:L-fuculose-phosphate aldolase
MVSRALDNNKTRHEMIRIATRMYAWGFISGLAGNLSIRLGDGRLLVTPAGVCKGNLRPEQLLILDEQGKIVSGQPGLQPTSELSMHLEIYQRRPDVSGIIHAHPVACVALSIVGISLDKPLIPEALVMLGPVPTVPYATPSSEEGRERISSFIENHNAMILAHHGTLTIGRDLLEAYYRLEILEHTARTVALAHQLGEPKLLTQRDIDKLI